MKAFFLCAGIGSRLRPFTDQKAKPSIPFLGLPLLHHVWWSLEPLEITELVVNLHHRPEDVRETAQLLLSEAKKLKLRFSDETAQLLDSGGGLHLAQSYFEKEKNFVLANGDEVFFLHEPGCLKDFKLRHEHKKNLATLLVMKHPEVGTKFGGAFADTNNQVQKFSKTSVPDLQGWHYVGVMLLSSRIFQYFKSEMVPENLLYDAITLGIAAGEPVEVFPAEMEWFEVGNPQDFIHATLAVIDKLKTSSDNWVDLLKQRIRWAYLQPTFIENSDSRALFEVSAILESLKS